MLRRGEAGDLAALSRLAAELWPHHTAAELAAELAPLLQREDAALFLALEGETPVGFAQCQLRRDYVEGTATSPVGYLEGVYICPGYRRQGRARGLVEACEAWAAAQGCAEFASDCAIENEVSLAFHLRAGFREAGRLVCLVKRLAPPASGVVIRPLRREDAHLLCDAENAQGWPTAVDKFLIRLRDAQEGKCISLAAETEGRPVGYVNVYPNCGWGACGGRGWSEIVDLAVLEKYRRRGIGSRLMEAAETAAAAYGDMVYLGVGLHSGYGSAQRLYIRRGYLPDGSGAWHGNSPAVPYSSYRLDDDLALYLIKRLEKAKRPG